MTFRRQAVLPLTGHQFWWCFKWVEEVPSQTQKLMSQSWDNFFFAASLEPALNQTPAKWGKVESKQRNPVVYNFVDVFYWCYWCAYVEMGGIHEAERKSLTLTCVLFLLSSYSSSCESYHFRPQATLTYSDQPFPRCRKCVEACAHSRHPAPTSTSSCENLKANGFIRISQAPIFNLGTQLFLHWYRGNKVQKRRGDFRG